MYYLLSKQLTVDYTTQTAEAEQTHVENERNEIE